MARIPLVNGEHYHVYNRGVLQQPIFREQKDYLRFVHCLYWFNDVLRDRISVNREIGSRKSGGSLVAILAWCLMPNHFHLFLRQTCEGGISLFIQRLEIGFTMYMNKKYKRSGYLFQGKYQAKLIEHDAHFLHISRYIHLNPLDLVEPGWGERGIEDRHKAERLLDEYRWSSYQDWLGQEHFSPIIDGKAVREMALGIGDYRTFVRDWISRDPISGHGV